MIVRRKENEILLVKDPFIYYLRVCKEFLILNRICRVFLVLFLVSLAFASQNAFAEIDIKKKAAEEYRLQGYDAQQKGNLEEALAYYQKAVTLVFESTSAPIYNDMGVIYEQMGLFGKAEESYLKAVKLNGRYLPVYSNLAYFYEGQGDTEKAITYLKKRVEGGTTDDVWVLRAKEELVRLSEGWPEIKEWLAHLEAKELSQELSKKGRQNFHDHSVVPPKENKKKEARVRNSQIAATLDHIEADLEKEKAREQSVGAALEEFESKGTVSKN